MNKYIERLLTEHHIELTTDETKISGKEARRKRRARERKRNSKYN